MYGNMAMLPIDYDFLRYSKNLKHDVRILELFVLFSNLFSRSITCLLRNAILDVKVASLFDYVCLSKASVNDLQQFVYMTLYMLISHVLYWHRR